jgi:hypothetical protein
MPLSRHQAAPLLPLARHADILADQSVLFSAIL